MQILATISKILGIQNLAIKEATKDMVHRQSYKSSAPYFLGGRKMFFGDRD